MRRISYAIKINRERSCYNYKKFDYTTRNCRNQGLVSLGKKIEYKNNISTRNNLKKKNLVVLN